MRQTPIYYYSSSSGLVRSFAERLGRPVFNLADREHRLSEADGPWVLLTPSYKSGNDRNDTVPEGVLRFLASDVNRRRMVGVIGSGNRNFGVHYQRACRVVAARSGRPVLFEFELSGTPWDVEECRRLMAELDEALAAHDAAPDAVTPHDETPTERPAD
ncbi:class Ib ribonucleoside-diphosphate reductase assembly flavoprotein NrdI [Cellulomonas sp. WB94]|uniref:class Ib ribonucleoside-diphosphate reductase assembly flavoprotein NrdI n=1 Tax=Cellulomonas sp. WB94 TaxID=2173174 RepID=UPI000D564962|nr:class Ib ribonucleoside-diphosphate reductase assembly flavoprotein NrdI [Cellulomonas sp. WB94]PVU82172.1 class Ib ribonucleoside-diphosphate reductase assembly flavoprotein NrdI [Cellulomonas sp. WB94]